MGHEAPTDQRVSAQLKASDFTGKSVFVAGGTSGINLGIARAFALAGAKIGVISRSSDKVQAATAELTRAELPAFGCVADVRDAEAVAQAMKDFADSAEGRIDIVISGAAGNFLAPAKDLSPNGFKVVIDIDLLGSFNVARAAYPFLRRPGGLILNISAPQAYVPIPNQVHACAAKAGVDQITRVLAKEWGPEGIRVNSIVPGAIAGTEGVARLAPRAPTSDNAADPVVRTVPLRRYGTIDDIAGMALFLASENASYVSGAVIPVDGGWGVTGPVASAG
jgi:NAD(P)-dependent dehydrogenase (short-subunit alcohol dehydrogenase family)